PQATREELLAEHQRWGALAASKWPRVTLRLRDLEPNRRLRIGYVSPDFRLHAVMRFFEPVLAAHDRQAVEIFLYAELPRPDDVTRRLATYPATWRRIIGRGAHEVARMVQEDRIDILIDLAGHTAHNRLDVLACKPAPVQATWLGYSNTTGLATVDYRISDAVVDPPGEPTWSSEQVLRLPASFACFRPPDGAPDIEAPPAARRGGVTFGSHHPPIKLNDGLLRMWREVLERVPGARLCFVRDQFSPALVKLWQQRVAAVGIDTSRIEFRAPSIAEHDYLSCFADIDIVLDSTPFNGHTMTCEALWMGVPVVTLRGERPMGRLSASVLTILGREEWIAETPDEYIARAAALAGDVQQLQYWRSALRPLVQERLGDGRQFARELESLYRRIWSDYCRAESTARQSAPPQLPVRDPTAPADWNQRGLSAVRRGDFAEAKNCFQQAVLLDPGYGSGWTNLGNAEKRLGRPADAERNYLTALSLEPASTDIHWSLGQVRQLLNRPAEALASYRHAMRLRPNWSVAACSLARLLASLGQSAEAIGV
ncbi:MAG TPA: tetratricopeptide repeat protein, partial [Pirellulales bacterium]|nr:tetratricopeptide repeat protein [Pirellulales bacterium]